MGTDFDRPDFDVSYFRYVRDQHGNLVPVNFARRNQRRVPYFPQSMIEPLSLPKQDDLTEYMETVDVVTYALTPSEKRCFLRMAEDGVSIAELAVEEGVSRAAIYCRFRLMRRKNLFVRVFWARKNHKNQHE